MFELLKGYLQNYPWKNLLIAALLVSLGAMTTSTSMVIPVIEIALTVAVGAGYVLAAYALYKGARALSTYLFSQPPQANPANIDYINDLTGSVEPVESVQSELSGVPNYNNDDNNDYELGGDIDNDSNESDQSEYEPDEACAPAVIRRYNLIYHPNFTDQTGLGSYNDQGCRRSLRLRNK